VPDRSGRGGGGGGWSGLAWGAAAGALVCGVQAWRGMALAEAPPNNQVAAPKDSPHNKKSKVGAPTDGGHPHLPADDVSTTAATAPGPAVAPAAASSASSPSTPPPSPAPSSSTSPPSPPSPGFRPGLPTYTSAEVATHNTCVGGARVWVTYGDGVFDITDFVANHPGGADKIMLAAGASIEPFWQGLADHARHVTQRILKPPVSELSGILQ
jgi:hypothetical protein